MFPWEPTAWLEKGKEMKKRNTILRPASASIFCTGGSLAGTFSRPWLFIDFFLRLLFRICKIDELWLCTAVPDAAAGASILGGGERMTANTRLLHSRTHVPWLWWSSIHMKGLCMCVCVCACTGVSVSFFLGFWVCEKRSVFVLCKILRWFVSAAEEYMKGVSVYVCFCFFLSKL